MTTETKQRLQITYGEWAHVKDSPICKERCGKGEVPIRVSGKRPEHHWFKGYAEALLFDGECLATVGMDYDDSGNVDEEVAQKLATYLSALEDCAAALEPLFAAYCGGEADQYDFPNNPWSLERGRKSSGGSPDTIGIAARAALNRLRALRDGA